MKRIHLFEFEDLSWFPDIIRNYMTDYLRFVANKFDIYRPIIPIIKRGVNSSGEKQVVDLCSGGGGSWEKLSEHLKIELPDTKVLLSDWYPNISAFEKLKRLHPENIDYLVNPVNATNVPGDLKGLRTQFLSFHHFRPEDAQHILQNALDSNQPIAIFEAQQHTIIHFLQFFFSPLNVLLFTPFIKPFNIGRIIFTYLIPIVPLFVWWDGLVSVLRTYSPDELKEMIEKLDNQERFKWEIDSIKSGPGKIYYLLGTPVKP